MKSLLLTLLLLVPSLLLAEETNIVRIITTFDIVLSNNVVVSSNVISTYVYKSTNRTNLMNEIKDLENKLFELTNGIPTKFISKSSENSSNNLDKLEELWNIQYPRLVYSLQIKKRQLIRTP